MSINTLLHEQMSGKTVYLISGANRGIGYGLAAVLAARPNTIVFAGRTHPSPGSPLRRPRLRPHFQLSGLNGTLYPPAGCRLRLFQGSSNFLVKVLDAEHKPLVALAIHPGLVATDTGNAGAVTNGLSEAPMSVDDSVAGILSRIDGATKEKNSGRFWNFKAMKGNPWDIDSDEISW
ncbi:hypothetical protein B0H11DRAFT_2297173 [Mycena galericulata]|nr:hypothetical protein B0H11DRAFT_2297173 [Mycena galericulata]